MAQLQHLSFVYILGFGPFAASIQLPNLKSLTIPTSTALLVDVPNWEMPSLVWVEVVVQSVDGLEMLSDFFQKYGRALEFLRLTAIYVDFVIPPSIFDHCSNLTTLSFDPLSCSVFDSISTTSMRHDNLRTLVMSMDGGGTCDDVGPVDQIELVETTMQYLNRGLDHLEEVDLVFMRDSPPDFASEFLEMVSVTFLTCRVVLVENPMLCG